MSRDESIGYVPERPHANVSISAETRLLFDRIHDRYEAGKLYEGHSGLLQSDEETLGLIRDSFRSFAIDLKSFLGAEEEESAGAVDGFVPRVNMWMEMIRWTDSNGWTYWGVHDHLREECRYLGRSKGKAMRFD